MHTTANYYFRSQQKIVLKENMYCPNHATPLLVLNYSDCGTYARLATMPTCFPSLRLYCFWFLPLSRRACTWFALLEPLRDKVKTEAASDELLPIALNGSLLFTGWFKNILPCLKRRFSQLAEELFELTTGFTAVPVGEVPSVVSCLWFFFNWRGP